MLKKRYWIILICSAIFIAGFIFLLMFLNNFSQNLIDDNGLGLGILASAFFALIGVDLYLLAILVLCFAGFLISKYRRKTEFQIAFKYQSWTWLIIWLGFTIYWMTVK